MAIAHTVGLFNVFVGLMLVASILLLGFGVVLWSIRLGTSPSYRDTAIDIMKWAVAVLFVLVVLLAIAQVVQAHTTELLFALGALITALAVYFLASELMGGSGEKKEKEEER